MSNNAEVASQLSEADISGRPTKEVAIVACMDGRIEPATVLGLRPGEAHVIRNAGGVVTEDVIRSLIVSQRTLGTREVMLIQHTDCGMNRLDEEALVAEIENDVSDRPSFSLGAFSDLEAHVRESLTRIRDCRFLIHTGSVRGFVYDVETCRLHEVCRPETG